MNSENTENRLLINSIAQKLGLESGSHDGNTYEVKFHALGKKYITIHEQIHDELIHTTLDGILLNRISLLAKNQFIPVIKRNIFEKTAEKIIKTSTVLHESSATYLSIKQCEPWEESEILKELPEDYINFYYNLSDLLDHQIPTTYMQYIVGKQLAIYCLYSPTILKIKNWDVDSSLNIVDDETCDVRFFKIIESISYRLPSLLSELCNIGAENNKIDVTEEYNWNNLDIDSRGKLDIKMSDFVKYWLHSELSDVIPVVKKEDIHRHILEFKKNLESQLEIYLDWSTPLGKDDLFKSEFTKSEYFRAYRDSMSHISSPNSIPEEKIQIIPKFDIMSNIMKGENSRYFFKDSTSEADFWTAFFITNDNVATVFGVSDSNFNNFLESRKMMILTFGMSTKIDGVFIKMSSNDHKPSYDLYDTIIDKFTNNQAGIIFETNLLFWYMDGSYLWWLERLSSQHELEIMSMFYDRDMKSVDPKDITQSDYVVRIIKSKSLPGIWFRVLNVNSSGSISVAELELMKSRKIDFVPINKREELGIHVHNILGHCFTCWEKL
jgi:hypothetical protein